MRTVCILLVILGACGGPQEESAGNEDPGKAPEEVSAEGKKWRGWRWKGKGDDCFFLHDRRCFKSFKRACKAAKCGKKECVGDDAAPQNVYCQGEEPPAKGEDALEKYNKKRPTGRKKETIKSHKNKKRKPASDGDSETMPDEDEDEE